MRCVKETFRGGEKVAPFTIAPSFRCDLYKTDCNWRKQLVNSQASSFASFPRNLPLRVLNGDDNR